MRKIVLIFVSLFIATISLYSQNIYLGNTKYYSNIIYVFDGKYLYEGSSKYSSNIVLTYDKGHIYLGNTTNSTNILSTWNDNKIYMGSFTNGYSNIVAIWKDNIMYYGKIPYRSNAMFRYANNRVYIKDSNYSNEVLLTTSSYVPPIVLYYIIKNLYYI